MTMITMMAMMINVMKPLQKIRMMKEYNATKTFSLLLLLHLYSYLYLLFVFVFVFNLIYYAATKTFSALLLLHLCCLPLKLSRLDKSNDDKSQKFYKSLLQNPKQNKSSWKVDLKGPLQSYNLLLGHLCPETLSSVSPSLSSSVNDRTSVNDHTSRVSKNHHIGPYVYSVTGPRRPPAIGAPWS